MAGWHTRHGSWWAAHWCWDGYLSLGVHVDWTRRRTAREGIPYGPYADVHLGPAVIGVGVHPIYSRDVNFRPGLRAEHH